MRPSRSSSNSLHSSAPSIMRNTWVWQLFRMLANATQSSDSVGGPLAIRLCTIFQLASPSTARSACQTNVQIKCLVLCRAESVEEKGKYRTFFDWLSRCAIIHEARIVLPQPGPPHMKSSFVASEDCIDGLLQEEKVESLRIHSQVLSSLSSRFRSWHSRTLEG